MINSCDQQVRSEFIDDLLKPKIVPDIGSKGVYRLKKDAASGIAKRLSNDGVKFERRQADFADSVCGAVRKNPLKQVGYGLLNATLPREIAAHLTPWEALYAYAGIWSRKSTPDPKYQFKRPGLERQPMYQIVRDLVFEGMRRIKYVHDEEHRRGIYKHPMKMSSKNRIKQRLKPATLKKEQVIPRQMSLF